MELVNYSRQLRAQIDTLDAAIEAKNNWAFGDAWDAHYTGQNRKWGDAFEDFINNVWMPNCNIRGPLYGFKTTMMLSGQAWDVDGDDVMVLTENANGFPQIAIYPATRISSSIVHNYNKTVTGGPYDGATICDGVIFDRNSRPIAVRIVGEDGTHQDISTYNADLAYEPKWSDQGRGIPRIAVSLLKWMNLQDIDEFLQRGMKRAAAVGLLKKTAEGEALPNEAFPEEAAEESPDGITRTVGYEEIEGGEMYYLSAPDGETIEGLDFKNPHPNVEAYIHRVHRGALQSVGWFLELIDLTATGRAPTRVLCAMANQSILSRQCTQYRRWKRAITYAVFKAMKTGYLARNDDAVDALRFEPGLPAPISVDAGNDAQADREALKLGLSTRSIISQKWHGVHFRALDAQRELELRATIKTAEGLHTDHPQLSFDRALELLEQRSPNPIAQQRQQPAKETNATQ